MKTASTVLILMVTIFLSSTVYARGPAAVPPDSPPREAINACSGKGETDTCEFVSPRGDTITGTCATIKNQLACKPEGGPPPRSGRNRNSLSK